MKFEYCCEHIYTISPNLSKRVPVKHWYVPKPTTNVSSVIRHQASYMFSQFKKKFKGEHTVDAGM